MKKQMQGQPKRAIPAFATEAEEAEWWHKNRNIHSRQLLAAVRNDGTQVLTKEELRQYDQKQIQLQHINTLVVKKSQNSVFRWELSIKGQPVYSWDIDLDLPLTAASTSPTDRATNANPPAS